jgi:amino acid transporter
MKKGKTISLFYLIMVSAAFTVSIRNLPTIAETQLQMIFFGFLASIIFFIPGALVSAELATGWPELGGIAVWVKEAFGKRWGLTASFFQWSYMIISVIAMLYFIASSLAFVFAPNLAENRTYLIICELILIWIFTILNLKGLQISKMISSIGFLSGVLFPAVLIIILGIIYIMLGNPIQMDLSFTSKNLFPDFSHISTIVLLVGFMRAFAGIEGSAAHANRVKNPKVNYPIAIFIVVCFGLLVNILGSLSVAMVIPQKDISLTAGVLDAFRIFFNKFNLVFLIPVLGFLAAVGQLGGFSTWITGPVKGLLKLGREGQLPPFLQKINKYEVPTHLMIIQAVVISIIGTFFLAFTPSINLAFWISVALSMLIYVSMYFLMFLSALYLRYKRPEVKRKFSIPGKNIGIWIVCMIGMIGMVLSFCIAFVPPAQFPEEHKGYYYGILAVGISIIFILPYIISSMEKPSWKCKEKNKELR